MMTDQSYICHTDWWSKFDLQQCVLEMLW